MNGNVVSFLVFSVWLVCMLVYLLKESRKEGGK